MKDRRHLLFWPVLVIGVALILIPFAMSIPSKTDAAQGMLNSLRPIMRAADVAKTAESYSDAFVKLASVAQEEPALAAKAGRLKESFAQRLDRSPALAIAVAALDHSKLLVDAILANRTNFQKLDNLPSFRLFAWIFVGPGILLVLIAGVPLAMGPFRRRASKTT